MLVSSSLLSFITLCNRSPTWIIFTYLGKVELQRVIGTQCDAESSGQELWQRVAVVVEEQRIVRQRGHGDVDLCQVVQVLENWHLENKECG